MKQTLAILVFISVFCTSLFAVVVNDPDDPGDPGNPLPNLIQQLSLTPNTFDRTSSDRVDFVYQVVASGNSLTFKRTIYGPFSLTATPTGEQILAGPVKIGEHNWSYDSVVPSSGAYLYTKSGHLTPSSSYGDPSAPATDWTPGIYYLYYEAYMGTSRLGGGILPCTILQSTFATISTSTGQTTFDQGTYLRINADIDWGSGTRDGYYRWYITSYDTDGNYISSSMPQNTTDYRYLTLDNAGTYKVRLEFNTTDGLSCTSNELTIQSQPMDAPEVTDIVVSNGNTMGYYQTRTYSATIDNPSGTALTYNWKVYKSGWLKSQWTTATLDSVLTKTLVGSAGGGCYLIKLTVTDGNGMSGVRTETLDVVTTSPSPSTSSPISFTLNETQSFSITPFVACSDVSAYELKWTLDDVEVGSGTSHTYEQTDYSPHTLRFIAYYNGVNVQTKTWNLLPPPTPDVVVNSVSVSSNDIIHQSSTVWNSSTSQWFLEHGFQLTADANNLVENNARLVWSENSDWSVGFSTAGLSGDGTTFTYTGWVPRYLHCLDGNDDPLLAATNLPTMKVLTDSSGNVINPSITRTGASGVYTVGDEPVITVTVPDANSVPISITTRTYNLIDNGDGTYSQGAILQKTNTGNYTLAANGSIALEWGNPAHPITREDLVVNEGFLTQEYRLASTSGPVIGTLNTIIPFSNNVPAIAITEETDYAITNHALTFPLSVTDADNDTVDVSVDWGDGTAVETHADAQGTPSVTHTYAADGWYTITLTAKDHAGIHYFDEQTETITVQAHSLPSEIANSGGYYNWRPECAGVFETGDYSYVYYLFMDPNVVSGLEILPETLTFDMSHNGVSLFQSPITQPIDTVSDPINGLNYDTRDHSLVLDSLIPAGSGEGSYTIQDVSLSYQPNSVSETVLIPVVVPESAQFEALGALSITDMNYMEVLDEGTYYLTGGTGEPKEASVFTFSKIVIINKNATDTIRAHFSFQTNQQLTLYGPGPISDDKIETAVKVAHDDETSTTYLEHKIQQQFVEAGGTAEWVDITSNIGAYYEEGNDGVFIYKTQSEPFSNAEEYQNKPVGDYTLKVRVQTYKVVRDNTSREILSEEIAPDACEGLVEGHLMVQLVDEVITATPATMDPAKFGGMSQKLLLELPRLNKVTCQQDHQNPMNFICQDPAGNPIKTYHDVSVLIFAADDVSRTTELARSLNSFVPADFDSTQREYQLMELNNSLAPGMYNVVFEEQKTFYTEDGSGNIIVDPVNVPAPQEPEFTEWTNTPQFTVGSVDADQVTFNPSTLNPLLDKDESGNLIADLVFEDESGHFSGSNTRYIRILGTVEGGQSIEPLTKTLIENGVDGVIISENYASKTTTVQVTRDFTDEETWPEGEYRIEIYLTDTATEPVCFGELKILKKPVNLVFYHHDHLGSTRMITDEDGGVVSTHDFAAYGEEITGSDFTENRMKFTGHERDLETDLDYMLARYYSNNYGRFLQVDPGYDYDPEDPMSWNLYSYVRSNPVTGVDATGESYLVFDAKHRVGEGTLSLYTTSGELVGTWRAHNYLTNKGKKKGPWPDGIYPFDYLGERNGGSTYLGEKGDSKGWLMGAPFVEHKDDSPNSSYGTYGSVVTAVFRNPDGTKRTVMAIHSGRAYKNFLDRRTDGCIRTEDIAMLVIKLLHQIDPLRFVVVRNNRERPETDEQDYHLIQDPLPHEEGGDEGESPLGFNVTVLNDMGPLAIVRVEVSIQ